MDAVTDAEINYRIQKLSQQAETPWYHSITQLFTIDYYKEYFDVTTELVAQRIGNSFNPFSRTFFDIGAGIPDLYGPFWILNTLIFAMAFSANLMKYLKDPNTFTDDFSIVPLATLIFYSKTILIPLIYRVVLKCYGDEKLTYTYCLCIYGYSASVLIPVTLLGCVPHPAVQWMLLLYYLFAQTCFLVNNFSEQLKFIDSDKKYIIVVTVAVVQIALVIVIKFCFFKTENYAQLGLINKHIHNYVKHQ